MTLRRKLAVSTIAASVAVTAFAGIPLSNKGLAEKLGVSGIVYAAAAGSHSDFLTEAGKIYAELAKINGGVEAVNSFRAEIANALDVSGNAILSPVSRHLDEDDRGEFEAVFGSLLSVQIGSGWESDLEEKREEHRAFLSELSAAAGVTLTVDDIAEVALALETNLAALAADVTSLENIDEDLRERLRLAAKDAIETNANVEAVVDYYEISSEDFANVYAELQASPEVNALTAFMAFLALNEAYEAANDDDDDDNGSIGGGGGGGGGEVVVPPVTIEVPKEASDLAQKLAGLKDQIANATGEEKAQLIKAAVEEAKALVDKLAKIESSVEVVGGKATLKLDESKTASAIAGIAEIAKGLQGATGVALPELKITIDLGAVALDDVAIDLSTAIMEQAVRAGLTAVSLKVGDLTVDLPIGGTFSKAVGFTINKKDASAEVTGGLKAASQVYDFNLSIGGVATTNFDKPITVSIPLGDTTGLDAELLSVAKIVDGKLEFQGGRVVGGHIVEPRDTFSSYVVLENKVAFNDLARVQAWAGRSIEVVAAKGAIIGKSEGVFAPDDKVTRAEFAKMLVRALDLDNGSAAESFDDVKAGDWHAPYVAAAAQLKIINGRSASKFDPNAKITRAEMATMIARALKAAKGAADVADVEAALTGFADAGKIHATLKEGVAFAASNGIVQGNAGNFLPNNNATRAEAAVMIYNSINFDK